MKTLKSLIKSCPCPVYMDVISGSLWHHQYAGYYQFEPDYYDYSTEPLPRVVVMANRTHAEKFGILAHEVQHAKCYENGCFCTKKNMEYYREYHAYKAQLEACFDYKEAMLVTIQTILGCANGKWGLRRHIAAAKSIVKTKLWEKALHSIE